MPIFTLKITSWRDPRCSRTIEFRGSQSLGDVHAAIQTEFELDDDHPWVFYLSGQLYDRESEFDHEAAWDAELRTLDLTPGMHFLYRFDFGDELIHGVEVVGVDEPEPAARYPRVVARVGTPPPQYPDSDDERGDDAPDAGAPAAAPAGTAPPAVPQALVEQVRAALDESLALGLDERRAPGGLAPFTQAAEAMLEACPTPAALAALSAAVGEYVPEWLTWLVRTLGDLGQAEAALPIAERLATITGAPREDELVAEVLRHLERYDEALARLARVMDATPTEADRLRLEIAHLHAEKGDPAAAEAELRRLLARRWVSGHLRDEAVPLLAEVLRASGRAAEAAALEAERRRQVAAAHPEIPHTIRRDAPKVGRNDPCPCGSGKKYKKCCGAN